MVFLTQESGAILGPIATVLGKILDLLFEMLGVIGLQNIGLCVILFTIIVKLIMMPLTVKQQKFSKLSAMMNPELQAIQAKYKNKKDNESLMKMNAETHEVYEKYGTSPTGGCLQMIIQLPIMFALYRVIMKIPAYVPSLKALFVNIIEGSDGAKGLIGQADFVSKISSMDSSFTESVTGSTNKMIDVMNKFSSSDWDKLKDTFPQMKDIIETNADKIVHMNNFFGINLSEAPGFKLSIALLIPILAGVTQWVSAKLMETRSNTQKSSSNSNGQGGVADTMATSMKMMTNIMPIMSAVFCITFPACIGLYWITSSVVQIVMQLFINRHIDKMNVDDMIAKNVEKVNAKRARKGLPPKKISSTAALYAESLKKQEAVDARKDERQKNIENSTKYYSQNSSKGSLAAKANMVKMYNEKNNKKDK